MNSQKGYLIAVITTGFIVLVLLSIGLYWARLFCTVALDGITPYANRRVRIQPCGLVDARLGNEPNEVIPSRIAADTNPRQFSWMGTIDYFNSRLPPGSKSNVFQYYRLDETRCVYFDKAIGKIVVCKIYREDADDEKEQGFWVREPELFVGCKGISATDNEKDGRFIEPTVDFDTALSSSMVIYDKGPRRFFRADLETEQITEGPGDVLSDVGRVVGMGNVAKSRAMIDMAWMPPLRLPTEADKDRKSSYAVMYGGRIPVVEASREACEYVLVLNESGYIYKLQRGTLAFAGNAGYLPAAPSYYSSPEGPAAPRDLLAYRVVPLSLDDEGGYRGIFVASLSGEGNGIALAVFDDEGQLVAQNVTMADSVAARAMREEGAMEGGGIAIGSDVLSKAKVKKVYFEMPWGPMLVGTRYAVENLQPPILGVASYFSSSRFEAGAGRRGLFILPHSTAGMLGRYYEGHRVKRLALLLVKLSPSILLAVLLAMAVKVHAMSIGLSERAVRYWTAATVAFGLCAYVTYRLTRPREKLVTCINCGRGRRPDMEKCHHCGSAWEVPELATPSWRVIEDFTGHAPVPETQSEGVGSEPAAETREDQAEDGPTDGPDSSE